MAWTFQSLIDDRMTVTAYCHNPTCNHNATLDLKRMRDRFGPDAPAIIRTVRRLASKTWPALLRRCLARKAVASLIANLLDAKQEYHRKPVQLTLPLWKGSLRKRNNSCK